jgi:long-chain acyl-CoA synthetase
MTHMDVQTTPTPEANRPWLASYDAGVAFEIAPSQENLVDLMNQACARFADHAAYISMGVKMTYAQLDRFSRNFAAWLQNRGVARGARVALMMPNVLQYPVALLGTLKAGCVVVNCNPLYTPRELELQLHDSGAEVIVVLKNFTHTLEQVQGANLRHVLVTSVGEMLGPKGVLVDLVLRHVKRAVPGRRLPGSIRFSDALTLGQSLPFSPPQIKPSDLAFLQYTGGTTGIPKGAMLTHGNIVANLRQVDAWVDDIVQEGKEHVVTALPLYHIFALTANCLTFMHKGATNLLIINPRDIKAFVKALKNYPFSVITGVNTLFNALLANNKFSRLDFSHLKVTLGGGMAVQQDVAQRWQQVTGRPLTQAYGLTETSPAATINPLTLDRFNGSIGLPISSTEVSVRDDNGMPVAQGVEGEICVRGPQVMVGYWNQDEETRAVFYPDGFLRTGDLGFMDAKGFVFLLDRKKDMIKVSGFNVYPNEIEDTVSKHPWVREAAAIGVSDPHSGEAIKLFVVPSDPRLTPEMVIAHCRKELTGYKIPRHIEFREELPHTNVGKILRRALKEGH